MDTGCSSEDLPEAMNDREKWRERVRDIRASGTTWWWWWYCHPHTDCFVKSQLCSVVRHVGGLNLGSKPAQFYVRLRIILLSQQVTNVSSGIIRHSVVAFVCLHFTLPDTWVLNSFEELCIMQVVGINSSARVLNHKWGAYILSSTDRLFRCITTLQCGKTRRTLLARIEIRPILR